MHDSNIGHGLIPFVSMVTTRAAAKAQDSPLPGKQTNGRSPGSEALNATAEGAVRQMLSWAETHGAGSHSSSPWGLEGVAGKVLAYGGTVALMLGCPAFAIYMCDSKGVAYPSFADKLYLMIVDSDFTLSNSALHLACSPAHEETILTACSCVTCFGFDMLCSRKQQRHRIPSDSVHCRWYILTQLEGSLSNVLLFAKAAGVRGVWNVWPRPSAEAWAIMGTFGAVQALLQLALPGKEHKGPVSPKGNVPVYKASHAQHAPCTLLLETRQGLCMGMVVRGCPARLICQWLFTRAGSQYHASRYTWEAAGPPLYVTS